MYKLVIDRVKRNKVEYWGYELYHGAKLVKQVVKKGFVGDASLMEATLKCYSWGIDEASAYFRKNDITPTSLKVLTSNVTFNKWIHGKVLAKYRIRFDKFRECMDRIPCVVEFVFSDTKLLRKRITEDNVVHEKYSSVLDVVATLGGGSTDIEDTGTDADTDVDGTTDGTADGTADIDTLGVSGV